MKKFLAIFALTLASLILGGCYVFKENEFKFEVAVEYMYENDTTIHITTFVDRVVFNGSVKTFVPTYYVPAGYHNDIDVKRVPDELLLHPGTFHIMHVPDRRVIVTNITYKEI